MLSGIYQAHTFEYFNLNSNKNNYNLIIENLLKLIYIKVLLKTNINS